MLYAKCGLWQLDSRLSWFGVGCDPIFFAESSKARQTYFHTIGFVDGFDDFGV